MGKMRVIDREKATELALGLGDSELQKDAYWRTCKIAAYVKPDSEGRLVARMGMNEYIVNYMQFAEFIKHMPGTEVDEHEFSLLGKEAQKKYIVIKEE